MALFAVTQAVSSSKAPTTRNAQDLDKKEAAADKQRESMMVGLNKTKTELGSLQDALARTQLDLEKTSFELHAKTSEHEASNPP